MDVHGSRNTFAVISWCEVWMTDIGVVEHLPKRHFRMDHWHGSLTWFHTSAAQFCQFVSCLLASLNPIIVLERENPTIANVESGGKLDQAALPTLVQSYTSGTPHEGFVTRLCRWASRSRGSHLSVSRFLSSTTNSFLFLCKGTNVRNGMFLMGLLTTHVLIS